MRSTLELDIVDMPEVRVITNVMTPYRFTKSLRLQSSFNHRIKTQKESILLSSLWKSETLCPVSVFPGVHCGLVLRFDGKEKKIKRTREKYFQILIWFQTLKNAPRVTESTACHWVWMQILSKNPKTVNLGLFKFLLSQFYSKCVIEK